MISAQEKPILNFKFAKDLSFWMTTSMDDPGDIPQEAFTTLIHFYMYEPMREVTLHKLRDQINCSTNEEALAKLNLLKNESEINTLFSNNATNISTLLSVYLINLALDVFTVTKPVGDGKRLKQLPLTDVVDAFWSFFLKDKGKGVDSDYYSVLQDEHVLENVILDLMDTTDRIHVIEGIYFFKEDNKIFLSIDPFETK